MRVKLKSALSTSMLNPGLPMWDRNVENDKRVLSFSNKSLRRTIQQNACLWVRTKQWEIEDELKRWKRRWPGHILRNEPSKIIRKKPDLESLRWKNTRKTQGFLEKRASDRNEDSRQDLYKTCISMTVMAQDRQDWLSFTDGFAPLWVEMEKKKEDFLNCLMSTQWNNLLSTWHKQSGSSSSREENSETNK